MLPLSLSLFFSVRCSLSFHSLTLTLALTCTLTHSHADSRSFSSLFFSRRSCQRGATTNDRRSIHNMDRGSRSKIGSTKKKLSFVEIRSSVYPFRETSIRRFWNARHRTERRNRKQKTRSAIFSRHPSSHRPSIIVAWLDDFSLTITGAWVKRERDTNRIKRLDYSTVRARYFSIDNLQARQGRYRKLEIKDRRKNSRVYVFCTLWKIKTCDNSLFEFKFLKEFFFRKGYICYVLSISLFLGRFDSNLDS